MFKNIIKILDKSKAENVDILVERAKDIFSEEYGNPYRMINIGAPMPYMNYTPRTFKEIVSGYEKWKKESKK